MLAYYYNVRMTRAFLFRILKQVPPTLKQVQCFLPVSPGKLRFGFYLSRNSEDLPRSFSSETDSKLSKEIENIVTPQSLHQTEQHLEIIKTQSSCFHDANLSQHSVHQDNPVCLNELDAILLEFKKKNSLLSTEEIRELFSSLIFDWGSKSFFHKIIKQIQHPETVLNFFFWLISEKDFAASTVEYNAILEILGAAKMFESMHLVMKHMDTKKCRMLPSTFTILIKYYGKAGLVDEATKTLADMRKYGVQPNVQTYNNIINAFVEEGKVDLVLGMFQQMSADGIKPNEYTLNFLVKGLCNSGRLEEARKLVQESSSSNIFVYNVLLKGFCRTGKVEEGYEIVQEMVGKGFSPDEYTFNTIVVGSCKAGKLDFALKMREEMMLRKISPNMITYGTLIMFLCRHKREEDAFQLLANMKSEGIVLSPEEQSSLKGSFLRTKRKMSAAVLIKEMGFKRTDVNSVSQ